MWFNEVHFIRNSITTKKIHLEYLLSVDDIIQTGCEVTDEDIILSIRNSLVRQRAEISDDDADVADESKFTALEALSCLEEMITFVSR